MPSRCDLPGALWLFRIGEAYRTGRSLSSKVYNHTEKAQENGSRQQGTVTRHLFKHLSACGALTLSRKGRAYCSVHTPKNAAI